MARLLSVHLLPVLFEPADVKGGVAVIVDILRASTTITYALANGADKVIPCASVKDALQLRNASTSDACLLGGERGGVRIDGFDLSNSPDDYSPEAVGGKTIGFTTTNGTKALLRAEQAEGILVGAFVNFTPLLEQLLARPNPLHIVCAGTDGVITGEDVLFAGALVAAIRQQEPDIELTDAATLACNHWLTECGELSLQRIEPALRRSQGGRNLIRLGYDKDITTAASVNSVAVVGIVDEHTVIRCCENHEKHADGTAT